MGPDAFMGSLLFALASVAGGGDPLGSVRELGFDIDVRDVHASPAPTIRRHAANGLTVLRP